MGDGCYSQVRERQDTTDPWNVYGIDHSPGRTPSYVLEMIKIHGIAFMFECTPPLMKICCVLVPTFVARRLALIF